MTTNRQAASANLPAHRVTVSPHHRVALALAALGLALRLAFALLPLAVHLVVLEDDAWMVAAIARNWALGRGITADGINATTGFQPLYPLTLGALPYIVAPNALDAGFTANLVICALLGTLACWPLWALARRFGGARAGVIAVALYALNPLIIRATVNAMETALGLLLLLTLFAAFYHLCPDRRPPTADQSPISNLQSPISNLQSPISNLQSPISDDGGPQPRGASVRETLLLALLTALAVLARLDAALAFAAIAVTMLLQGSGVRGQGSDSALIARRPSPVARRQLSVAIYVATTLLLLAPYFAFNRIVGGSFGPSSGVALAYLHSYAGAFNLTNGFQALYLNTALDLHGLSGQPRIVALIALALAGALVGLLGRRLRAALPLLLYLPVPPLYYGYLLQQSRERYFVGLSAVLIILLAWLGAEATRRWPGRAALAAVAGAAAALIALNSAGAWAAYQRVSDEQQQTQPTAYQAALWVRDHLPADALIGAKNSGIYQYYSGHTVLNIDGKLNHEIVPVLEQRALLDYLRGAGVTYLVDREETMARHIGFYSAPFGPAPRHRAPALAERLTIYGKIAANLLGAHQPLGLDDPPERFVATRPFSDVAVIVRRFERPNDARNPVVVYRLKP